MKVLFNRSPMNKPWGGGNQFLQEMSALLKSQGHEVVYKFSPNIDILFILLAIQSLWTHIQYCTEP